MTKNIPKSNRNRLLLCLILSFVGFNLQAQFVIKDKNKQLISLHKYAQYTGLNSSEKKLEEVMKMPDAVFHNMKGETTDFGFTNDNYWIKFGLLNDTAEDVTYFLETARPITNFVELYSIKGLGEVTKQVSGDAIPYNQKSFEDRKSIFEIKLKPYEKVKYYLHVKSDGESLTIPLLLHTTESFLRNSSFEQAVFGFFYGVLFIAAILYLFFFFAMREKVFLYYSLYIVFIGLLQFSVDGYFYQLITPNLGWLSLHCVLLFATIANFCLGRYAQIYLKINQYNTTLNSAFWVLYAFDLLCFLILLFLPSGLEYCYPLANLLGLVLLILIVSSLVVVRLRTKKIDRFFASGIFFLVAGFVIFILKNFSILPLNFWTENSSKLGTGLEVIFLSLSMANLIRILKNEREELQELALERSEEMNELKSYFLSNISHELRTPLNAIINVTDAIISENKEEKLINDYNIIKYSSQTLLGSVDDILDFSKIEKNQLKLEKTVFEPLKILQQISNIDEQRAKEKDLKFIFTRISDIPEFLIGDGIRLGQIVSNVLYNAVKFTIEGQVKFEVDWKSINSNKMELILTISDTGVGIPKERMNSIFDSFSQESSNNKRKYSGLGLGLYIVKNLVDLHDGTIEVNSKKEEGTTFKIILPYEIAKIEKKNIPEKMADEEFDLKGKKVLVVEDNEMNQAIIKIMTKKWLNTTFSYSNNGEDALHKLKENEFDIVLMDLQMPIMDGYEATIAIRNGEAGEKNKNIPIIAITADVMETTKERVIDIGMNKYMSKPIDKVNLFKSMVALL